ncbi:hypothetical protein DEO72_LG10g2878 [Vigna unguiculata]|uniref:Knottin n=1 Tax=Vigna unguiculata TaxID=3917 RepID=A0A4D6NCS5_VIGUN|nr:hypothetical protein DEO72_LG10g2878 [Vigna unguiculata]
MASRFCCHPFLFGVLFVALVLTAGTGTVAGSGGVAKGVVCIKNCFPDCYYDCLRKGFVEGFCVRKGADSSCCCK